MSKAIPLLSIIIVNYRSAHLILDCLKSVVQYSSSIEKEFIVVDNHSNDRGKETIAEHFPEVKWIDMNYNSGFARANNAGIKIANGDVLLLLNPDTIVIDDSITKCFHQLVHSNYLACGVQQLNADGSTQISGNYFIRGGLNHLLPIPYWGGFIRWVGYQTKSKIPNVQEAKAVEEVDWISGAFLMVKKEAIQKAGLMDEDFFLYAEEVEWCSRLRKHGKLCIFGDLNIIHLEGGSINKEQNAPDKGYYNLFDKKGLQLMVSNHLRVRKQYGVFWFLFLLLNYSWGVVVFFICASMHQLIKLKSPLPKWQLVYSFAKNVLRLWSLAPAIISGKPHFYKMF